MSDLEPSTGHQNTQGNGLAIAAMVLGIIGLVGLCFWPVGLPCAILALIFGIISRKKAKETGVGGGMATAGFVLGIIALALAILGVILAIVGFTFFKTEIEKEMERQRNMQQGSLVLLLPLLLMIRSRIE